MDEHEQLFIKVSQLLEQLLNKQELSIFSKELKRNGKFSEIAATNIAMTQQLIGYCLNQKCGGSDGKGRELTKKELAKSFSVPDKIERILEIVINEVEAAAAKGFEKSHLEQQQALAQKTLAQQQYQSNNASQCWKLLNSTPSNQQTTGAGSLSNALNLPHCSYMNQIGGQGYPQGSSLTSDQQSQINNLPYYPYLYLPNGSTAGSSNQQFNSINGTPSLQNTHMYRNQTPDSTQQPHSLQSNLFQQYPSNSNFIYPNSLNPQSTYPFPLYINSIYDFDKFTQQAQAQQLQQQQSQSQQGIHFHGMNGGQINSKSGVGQDTSQLIPLTKQSQIYQSTGQHHLHSQQAQNQFLQQQQQNFQLRQIQPANQPSSNSSSNTKSKGQSNIPLPPGKSNFNNSISSKNQKQDGMIGISCASNASTVSASGNQKKSKTQQVLPVAQKATNMQYKTAVAETDVIKSCICSQSPRLKNQLGSAPELLQCRNKGCENKLHLSCMKISPRDDESRAQFECPSCILKKYDPLHSVEEVLIDCQVIQNKSFDFTIKSEIYSKIRDFQNYAIEVRCIRIDGSANIYETTWPDFGVIQMNGELILELKPLQSNSSLKKRKDEKYTFKGIKNLAEGKNQLQIKEFSPLASEKQQMRLADNALHCISIFVIRKFTVDELVARIKNSSSRSIEDCKSQIQQYFKQNGNNNAKSKEDDDEVCIDSLSVPLTCSLDMKLIQTPAKGLFCKHFQCFSLENFVITTETVTPRKWRCNICKAKCYEIIVDTYLLSIIQEINDKQIKHVSDVKFDSKANYMLEISNNQALDDDDDDDEYDDSQPPMNTNSTTNNKGITINNNNATNNNITNNINNNNNINSSANNNIINNTIQVDESTNILSKPIVSNNVNNSSTPNQLSQVSTTNNNMNNKTTNSVTNMSKLNSNINSNNIPKNSQQMLHYQQSVNAKRAVPVDRNNDGSYKGFVSFMAQTQKPNSSQNQKFQEIVLIESDDECAEPEIKKKQKPSDVGERQVSITQKITGKLQGQQTFQKQPPTTSIDSIPIVNQPKSSPKNDLLFNSTKQTQIERLTQDSLSLNNIIQTQLFPKVANNNASGLSINLSTNSGSIPQNSISSAQQKLQNIQLKASTIPLSSSSITTNNISYNPESFSNQLAGETSNHLSQLAIPQQSKQQQLAYVQYIQQTQPQQTSPMDATILLNPQQSFLKLNSGEKSQVNSNQGMHGVVDWKVEDVSSASGDQSSKNIPNNLKAKLLYEGVPQQQKSDQQAVTSISLSRAIEKQGTSKRKRYF